MTKTDVVVIGAGCAGLSAAVQLAAAGCSVVVAEEAPRLGGRATAFTDKDSGERVDNGQHALFGCYRATYDLLRSIGAAHLAPLQSRLAVTMVDASGRAFELRCPALPPPWHLLAGILRWPALSMRDRWSALGLRSLLAATRRDGAAAVAARVPPGQTVATWLEAHGQSARLSAWLWHPLAIAALNQSPEVAVAAPFVRVLAEMFGPRVEDSSIGLPSVPLDELFGVASQRFIEARGGRVLIKSPARVVMRDPGAIDHVRVGGEPIECRAVVSAVPWHALDRLWDAGVPPALTGVATRARAMASAPIVTVNVWLDGPLDAAQFIGLVGRPMHWIFDKRAIFDAHAAHLSVVTSGADDIVRLDNATLAGMAIEEIRRAIPAAKARTMTRSVVVREHRATFSLAPGQPPRPPNHTPLAGFYLAGDWTDTGLPATIESAVVSGRAAADLALAHLAR